MGHSEKADRGEWGNHIEFLLACIGYAVGLGNVWRFPYLTYENGGGAFLIPYLISLIIAGLPAFFMELALGQFSSLGPNCIFGKLAPISHGIGWAMVIVSLLVGLYYNMIIAWVLFYLFASFAKELPWTGCRNPWNTFESFENTGGMSWKLPLCLLGAWIIVFLCLIKGVQSTGKVVYFTATFPYVVLFILLIRGATLPGALGGIKFYMVPKFHKLKDVKVWKAASTQIFYSLGPAFGGLITMASYNKFHNNCMRDAIVVAVGNCLTSIFAGFVIFSIVGFMAQDLGKPVEKITKSGAGLAFVMYPEALSRMPVGPMWSCLFFFMLITLGLDSQFAMVETVTTALMDQFPILRKWKTIVIAATCSICFLLGLPLCSRNGYYIFSLIDSYSAGYSLILIALCELLTVTYIYGLKRFCKDIEMMLVRSVSWYWKICWYALAPLFLVFIFVFSLVDNKRLVVKDYEFSDSATGLGWAISLVSIVMIPIFAIYKVFKYVRQNRNLRDLFRSKRAWCPAHVRESLAIKQLEMSGGVNSGRLATVMPTSSGTTASVYYPGYPSTNLSPTIRSGATNYELNSTLPCNERF